jgi:hypothetical protein
VNLQTGGAKMRTAAIRLLLLLGAIVAILLILDVMFETRGVGRHDQRIRIVADKPIRRVTHCCLNLDDETKQLAEATADPKLFDMDEAELLGADQYKVKFTFTTRAWLIRKAQVFHPTQLVVYAEFRDGSLACRVIDLPAELSDDVITVHFGQ